MPLFAVSPLWSAMFWSVYVAWALQELLIFRRDRRRVVGWSEDRGSLFVLVLAIVVAVMLAFSLSRARGAAVGAPPALIEPPALALMLVGMALRGWAVATLGAFFRVTVTAQTGHQLIEAGPYRRLRHPAYTGTLLTVAGMGLAMGNWLSLVAAFGCATAGFAWRIRVEESSLLGLFGDDYAAFAMRRWALLPGLW